MRTIALASPKSSPGVTTLAVALGATWPSQQQVVVIEADPFGGDLATRFDLQAKPGLVSFATEARRTHDPTLLWQHTQMLAGGLSVLSAPPSGDQTRGALGLLTSDVFRCAAAIDDEPTTAIIDIGRVDSTAPSWQITKDADFVVVCIRPVLSEIHHLVATVSLLTQHRVDVVLVLIGDGPYASSDIAQVAKVEVLARLPFDAPGAAALCGANASRKAIHRSALLRSSRDLGEQLVERLAINDLPTQEEVAS